MDLVALGVDVAIAALFWKFYKSGIKHASYIEDTPTFEVNADLEAVLKDGPVDYACVEGVTSPVGKTLQSQFIDEEVGVIRHVVMKELKSQRIQGFWSDVTRHIRNTVDTVPFLLANMKDAKKGVTVYDPNSADYVSESLKTTYDNFQESQRGLLEKGLDRVFGEVTKGVQSTEKMLGIGVHMLGFGKLVYEDSKMKLVAPSNGQPYILTTMDKQEILRRLRGGASVWKVFSWIFGLTAVGIGIYIFVNRYRIWKDRYDMYILQQQLTRQRQEQSTRNTGNRTNGSSIDSGVDGESEEETCTICLANRREVVLLDCGHICVCGDCAQLLPLPRMCPVCRANVIRILPIYRS